MRIVAAMSGGVDSTVAALLLKQKGHDVIGITMKTWPSEECGLAGEKACCSLEAVSYARAVAEDIDIPHYALDLSSEFDAEIGDYFASEYSSGRTPSPCIYCNSRIKFGHLMKKAEKLGAEAVATGHYARIITDDDGTFICESSDLSRDQSYFLSAVPGNIIGKILFPLGGMTKTEVRAMAAKNGLMSAERPDSQDICFAVPGHGYREYLKKKGEGGLIPGEILDTSGKVIGRHEGIANYTLGQRRGLGLGLHFSLYVTGIDPEKNTITVGNKSELLKKRIVVKMFNWLMNDGQVCEGKFDVRIRHGSSKAEAFLSPRENGTADIEFTEEQFAPTPGQAAVFYSGDKVAGGGWIETF